MSLVEHMRRKFCDSTAFLTHFSDSVRHVHVYRLVLITRKVFGKLFKTRLVLLLVHVGRIHPDSDLPQEPNRRTLMQVVIRYRFIVQHCPTITLQFVLMLAVIPPSPGGFHSPGFHFARSEQSLARVLVDLLSGFVF